ncbi:MAG: ClbS/DfsB family four-helix bundle protein [Spirochaetaceae bacterium]|nr:ClbS/DfsB family four-helix bundle protein [Spirochaetaceae bacterium]
MQEYSDKNTLVNEIKNSAEAFIKEFDDVQENEKDLRFDGVDRTPGEMIAYQLGWMELIQKWDKDELAGKELVMPAPGLKWNQMGELYQTFYDKYRKHSLKKLCKMFVEAVDEFIQWFQKFSEKEIFQAGGRKWASSTPSNWPIWKWVHINTVAPFKSFRSKIRKWKKIKIS